MQVPTHEEVLRAIDAFLDRHPAIGASRFGRDATGEPGLVARLRKGSTPTLNVLARIKAFMDAKDADLSSEVGQHERFDIARGVHPSSGTETNFSASIRTGSAVALLGSEAAVAEGEGVSPLPGGACK